jgi:hypothetical protein
MQTMRVLLLASVMLLALPYWPSEGQNTGPSGVAKSNPATTKMPWEPDGSAVAELAIQGLQDLLMKASADGRGVHVQTLMTTAGALAGFAAQHAVWETVVKTGRMPETGGANLNAGAFVVASTQKGERYYFGDLLNSYIVPQGHPLGPGAHTLWNFLAGIVTASGGKPVSNEEIAEIFRNAATTVGGPSFGVPRVPQGHASRIAPREALRSLWPAARRVLSREHTIAGKVQQLAPAYWPHAMGIAIQRLIARSKDALDPALSMRIVLEAAIPMSKVDPKTISAQ